MNKDVRVAAWLFISVLMLLTNPAGLAGTLPGQNASVSAPLVPSPVGRFNDLDATLVSAGLKGDVNGMREAIRLGANPNAIDTDGLPALCWLMFAKKREGFAFLVANGGTGRLRIGARQLHATVYEEAAVKKDSYWFTTLFDKEVDPNFAIDVSSGRTILQYLIFYDRLDLVEYVLRAGADINRADKFGASPLLVSVTQGVHLKTALFLLKNGANPQCSTPKTGSFIDNLVRVGTSFPAAAKQTEAWRDYLSVIEFLESTRVQLPDSLVQLLHEK